jgi:hypothetical protein
MAFTPSALCESRRLEALVRQVVGWQIDDLCVLLGKQGLILHGRGRTPLARILAQVEAAQLSGLPVVENRIEVI